MFEDVDIISYGKISIDSNRYYQVFKSIVGMKNVDPIMQNILVVFGTISYATKNLLNVGFGADPIFNRYSDLSSGSISGIMHDPFNHGESLHISVNIYNDEYNIRRFIDTISPQNNYYFMTTIEHETDRFNKSKLYGDCTSANNAIKIVESLYGKEISRKIVIFHLQNSWRLDGVNCKLCDDEEKADMPKSHICSKIAYVSYEPFHKAIYNANNWFMKNPTSGRRLLAGYALNNNSKNK
jgi:hypothetical protein